MSGMMLNFSGVSATSIPGAPTIGTATATSGTTATVSFTAPASNGGSVITLYTATSSPSGITGTLSQAGSGTITVSGLSGNTAYTFTVTATNAIGTGPASAASNSITPVAAGQQQFTSPGTFSWVAPTGVTSVSVVVIGGGAGSKSNQYNAPGDPGYNAGGSGGGLAWKNNYTVIPGNSYTLGVAYGGNFAGCEGGASRADGGESYFVSGSGIIGYGASGSGPAGSYSGDGGGTGGFSLYSNQDSNGAGGAGGYSGAGGAGGIAGNTTGKVGSGGGGSGGGYNKGNGGGVGLLGEGTSGAAVPNGADGNPGSGGFLRLYGGGGGSTPNTGGGGAVRIIWAGSGPARAFPSTNTGNL